MRVYQSNGDGGAPRRLEAADFRKGGARGPVAVAPVDIGERKSLGLTLLPAVGADSRRRLAFGTFAAATPNAWRIGAVFPGHA